MRTAPRASTFWHAAFDERTGYRSQSFLTVPMKNHDRELIGVLQLINARDPETGAIIPFSQTDQSLAEVAGIPGSHCAHQPAARLPTGAVVRIVRQPHQPGH